MKIKESYIWTDKNSGRWWSMLEEKTSNIKTRLSNNASCTKYCQQEEHNLPKSQHLIVPIKFSMLIYSYSFHLFDQFGQQFIF